MKEIKNKIKDNYLFGLIEYKNTLNCYLMPIAWWILNHDKYDPNYDPIKWGYVFRNNVNNVTDDKIIAYLKAIEDDKISIKENKKIIAGKIKFFIDFNQKKYITNFYDIDLEDYLPNESWEFEFRNGIIG